jgi:dihydrofolate reductase
MTLSSSQDSADERFAPNPHLHSEPCTKRRVDEKAGDQHVHVARRRHAGARRPGGGSERRVHARRLGRPLLRRRNDGADERFRPYELLLGRGTHEIFAAHWPYSDGPIADRLNSTRKLVASRTLEQSDWSNSTVIRGDVPEYVARLKSEDGPETQVHGSPDLIQTLLEHDLIDELRIRIFPLVLGTGKRLFGNGTIPVGLRLVDSTITKTGVAITTFERAGEIEPGSFEFDEPTEAELKRRERLAAA